MEIVRPRRVFEIVDEALRHYRQRFRDFFVLFLPVGAASIVSTAASLWASPYFVEDNFASFFDVAFALTALLLSVVLVVGLQLLAYGGAILMAGADLAGRPMTSRAAWTGAQERFFALLGSAFVFMLPVMALALVFLVAAIAVQFSAFILIFVFLLFLALIFLFVRWALQTPSLLLEPMAVVAAFTRSWDLSRGQFWRAFGAFTLVLLLVGIITGVASSVSEGLPGLVEAGLLEATPTYWVFYVLAVLVTAALEVATAPLVAIFWTHFYVDLRIRREGLDITNRISALESAAGSEPPAEPPVAPPPGSPPGPPSAPPPPSIPPPPPPSGPTS